MAAFLECRRGERTVAYNKLRREIMDRLTKDVPNQQQKLADKLETSQFADVDDHAMANCSDWHLFRARALRAEEDLVEANRTLRKVLIALGGPVADTRPKVEDRPTAQIEHPCETPAVAEGEDAALDYPHVVGGCAACAVADEADDAFVERLEADSLPSVSEETSAVTEAPCGLRHEGACNVACGY